MDEEDEDEEEEDDARRRSDSVSPSIFPSDPDPFARTRVSPPNTTSIDGLPVARPGTGAGAGTSLLRDQLRSSSLASKSSRREISPRSSDIRPSLTESTPILAKGDADGIGIYVEPGSPTLSTGRRRSSTATALKRRRSGEVGKSTNGQTVRLSSTIMDT